MEVFVAFIQNHIPLVVIMSIAVVGIIGISATLIALKIRSKILKNKSKRAEEATTAE